MKYQPQTWHYGIMAKTWAEFHVDGPEIAYYQKLIEQYGQPALDVACGTGRLLLPFLRAGLDVDGCDISADMLAHCRQQAEEEGLTTTLEAQAMHELHMSRAYRTIFVCGSFGIGSTREQDAQALQRFYDHLTPGGVLLLEISMPYGAGLSWCWKDWLLENRQRLDPDFWTEPEIQRASDGSEYRTRSRLTDLDPMEQVTVLEIWAEIWRDGQLVEQEERMLTSNIYFKNEMLLMLRQAGFEVIAVQGDFTEADGTAEHSDLVFIARK